MDRYSKETHDDLPQRGILRRPDKSLHKSGEWTCLYETLNYPLKDLLNNRTGQRPAE